MSPREAYGGVIGLSRHELTVLAAAADGETIKQTAERLNYSHHTITDRRKVLLAKLQARTIAQAVAIGIRKGLIA